MEGPRASLGKAVARKDFAGVRGSEEEDLGQQGGELLHGLLLPAAVVSGSKAQGLVPGRPALSACSAPPNHPPRPPTPLGLSRHEADPSPQKLPETHMAKDMCISGAFPRLVRRTRRGCGGASSDAALAPRAALCALQAGQGPHHHHRSAAHRLEPWLSACSKSSRCPPADLETSSPALSAHPRRPWCRGVAAFFLREAEHHHARPLAWREEPTPGPGGFCPRCRLSSPFVYPSSSISAAAAQVQGGTVRKVSHASDATKTTMEFTVFLPDSASPSNPVPVLYYLSGLTCTRSVSPSYCFSTEGGGGAFLERMTGMQEGTQRDMRKRLLPKPLE